MSAKKGVPQHRWNRDLEADTCFKCGLQRTEHVVFKLLAGSGITGIKAKETKYLVDGIWIMACPPCIKSIQ